MSNQIAQSVIYIDNAKELWEDLQERYSKENYFRISDILQEIYSIKQGERSISEFFTELKVFCEELEFLRPTPNCTCEKLCTCDLMKNIIKHRESEYVICFLKGLNDVYNTVKTQILIMEPLPTVNRVFSLVLQQERQLTGGITFDSKSTLNAANVQGYWKQTGKNNTQNNWKVQGRGRTRNPNFGKQCTYCNK